MAGQTPDRSQAGCDLTPDFPAKSVAHATPLKPEETGSLRRLVRCIVAYFVIPGAVFVLAFFGLRVLFTSAATTPPPAPMTDPMTQDYDTMRMSVEYGCSADGLGDVIPGGAIVWRDGGPVHTSFDEGWAVHESGEGGTLLAVCER